LPTQSRPVRLRNYAIWQCNSEDARVKTREQQKKISLQPLEFNEAISDLLRVKPPKKIVTSDIAKGKGQKAAGGWIVRGVQ
jgi:hypothetical protein